jgi:histidinol-phosphate aminotransferase
MTLAPKPGVLDIAPYVAGRETAVANPIDLSSNESALGPSPGAIKAYEEGSRSVSLYPDGSARMLRQALGNTYGLDPSRIVCSNGSNELLSLIANAYVRPGDEVLFSRHAFLVYRLATLSHSGVPVTPPEKNLRVDVDAMLAAVSPKTRLVYLANPNNPTGTYLKPDEVRHLHAGLSPDTLLVIDAAYAEYVCRDDYRDGLDMAERFPNVLATRTFSKVYGLAGLRIGWAYGPGSVIDVLNRVRDPFNVSAAAQSAAIAALQDRDHVRRCVAHNERWRAWIIDALRSAGLEVGDSAGNFVLIRFPASPGKTAGDADRYLFERGLNLRSVANYGLPDCLRMTIGTEEANRKVAATLAEFMGRG